MSIGQNIDKRLKELGVTQSELARLSKISTSTINDIIKKPNSEYIKRIKKIALTLHTTTDRLIFDEEELNEDDELKILFLEVGRMSNERKKTAKDMLKALIIQNKSEELAKI